jgi:mono/diheme cytochrome c family protein
MLKFRRHAYLFLAGAVAFAGAVSLLIPIPNAIAAENGASDWKAPDRAAKRKNPIISDDQSIAAGKTVYNKECISCHGTAGKGDGPGAKDLATKPGDLSDPKLRDETDGALFWKITEGKKPMPTFAKLLSDDQRWQVVNYIRTLAPKSQNAQPQGDSR